MSTIFSKIVSGEIPAYIVAETNDYLAFMDVFPIAPGHVLVIPKKETDYIFDVEDEAYIGLWLFAKIIAQAIKNVYPCKRVGVSVVGLEVAHAHIHLIPINEVSDMDFTKEKLKFTSEEFQAAAEKLKVAIRELTAK
jgi:histidine triad (HIT) family protein